MRKITRASIIVILLSTMLLLSACEWTLTGKKESAVLAFSETVTDNLFNGLSANDYTVFSRDFDSDMLERVPATDFADLKKEFDHNLGNYRSRQVDRVTRVDEFEVVYYTVKFDKEEKVTVTIYFHSDRSIVSFGLESDKYSWPAW